MQWVNIQWFSPTSMKAVCSAQSELFFRLLLKNTVSRAHRAAYPNIHEDKASPGSHRRCEGRMVQMLSRIHEDKPSLESHRRCEGWMVQMFSHIHEDKASLGSHRRCEGRMVQMSGTQVTISDNF